MLDIHLLQYDISWQSPTSNITTIDRTLNEAGTKMDILLLPEMWSTGFVMTPQDLAQPIDGPCVEAMSKWAAMVDGAVIGSLMITEDGAYYNRMLLVDSTGIKAQYDKHYLFGLAGEAEHYSRGLDKAIWQYRGWKICPQVCYDLRFPEWARNYEGYDLLLYTANWPRMRHHAWRTLLRARAIENQCYVAGCNRVGRDGNGYPYKGGSAIIDYKGKTLAEADQYEGIVSYSLSQQDLHDFRQQFPFLDDIDPR